MKKIKVGWVLGCLIGMTGFGLSPEARACGHEGPYFGLGYSQLFLLSLDDQLVASGTAAGTRVKWDPRFGGHLKMGYDFCGTRYGFEVPIFVSKQQLNQAEDVYVIGADANILIHLRETEGGADLFWIIGVGGTVVTEGGIKNNTASGGVNFNTGPGFQYFFARGKNPAAFHVALPLRAILFVGDTLSSNMTTTLAIPLQLGFTLGF